MYCGREYDDVTAYVYYKWGLTNDRRTKT